MLHLYFCPAPTGNVPQKPDVIAELKEFIPTLTIPDTRNQHHDYMYVPDMYRV